MCSPVARRVSDRDAKKEWPVMYNIDFTTEARKGLAKLERSEPNLNFNLICND